MTGMDWSGKRVLVLGLGRSGEPAAGLLARLGARVSARDSACSPKLEEAAVRLRAAGVSVELSAATDPDPAAFDLAVVSPGIDPRRGWVQVLERAGVPVWSELEFGFQFCRCPVAAVTGTNGKTTTTELCDAVLRAGRLRSRVAGNIGDALSRFAEESGSLDVLVVEVSSFQLERIRTFRPRAAAMLNITPDHFDRYDSPEDYRAAKMRVFENQSGEDLAVVNASLGLAGLKARTETFTARGAGADYSLSGTTILRRGVPVADLGATRLRGLHNAENAMAAAAIGLFFGVAPDRIQAALSEYTPAAHRCEWVGEDAGVAYINDSKATNPDAVAVALESQERPVVLIAGGSEKNLEFEALAELVARKTRAVILIGQTAPRIEAAWRRARCLRASSMEEAVTMARAEARGGDIVMLSPGCASFDMFRDYADRGEQFKAAVRRNFSAPAPGAVHEATTDTKGERR